MDNEIDILGYVLFRQDRNDGYGGVALYVKDYYMPLKYSYIGIEPIECIWIKISQLVGSIYCTFQALAQYFDLIFEHIEATRDCFDKLILMGDFNFDIQKENRNLVTLQGVAFGP